MTKRTFALAVMMALISACATVPDKTGSSEWDSANLGDGGTPEFYRYRGPIPATPGVILRQEPLEERQSLTQAGSNLRLLYTSTDGLGGEQVLPVSGTLYLPAGKPPEGGWPLMAWTHGTVGIADICAPSWDGRQKQDEDYLNFWLAQGFAVVASDYQGLGTPGIHPYLATRPEAYSNLDIIRAVQNGDFPLSDRVVLIGQSQGAGAAVATAAFAPDYAPELDIRGLVATGVPYFSPQALVALNASRPPDMPDPMLGYNLLAMTLAEQIVPGFDMRSYITPEARPIAERVADTCYKDIRARVVEAGLSYNTAFTEPPSEALKAAFAQMGFPRLDIGVPVFLGIGGRDRDTPQRMQAAFKRDACAAGSQIEAHIYTDLDHRAVVPGSTGQSLPFVQRVFGDIPLSGVCTETTW